MDKYTGDVIVSLRGADRVRKRPAVIFGSARKEGCLEAIKNLIDNSTIECRSGHGDCVEISRFEDNSYEIIDYGRGIPVEYNEQEEQYNWHINFCELYAGGKFEAPKKEYEFSVGAGGIGLCAVQYASEYMEATIYREDKKYTLRFEKGENVGGLKVEDNTENKRGTRLLFKLDDSVFDDTIVDFEMIESLTRGYAVSNRGITYKLKYFDSGECKWNTYCYQTLSDYLKYYADNCDLKTFEVSESFNGVINDRQCHGSINVCAAFTPGQDIVEAYHHERYLSNGGVGLWEISKMIEEKIISLFKDMELAEDKLKKIMANMSIIIHTELFPMGFVRWTDGIRSAITNPIIAEQVRLKCDSIATELVQANKHEITKCVQ